MPLIEALKDRDRSARSSIEDALVKIGDEMTVEYFIQILKSGNERARRRAVRAFEEIGNDRVVEPLIEALKDEDV